MAETSATANTDSQVSDQVSPAASSPRVRPNLLNLPQEIQDIIFDLAYGTGDKEVMPMWKHQWNKEESSRSAREYRYTPRPFPGPHVDSFLVSKNFFIAAAQAYVQKRIYKPLHTCAISGEYGNVITAYATDAIMSRGFVLAGHTGRLPNLKRLTVIDGFDDTATSIWDAEMSENELRASDVFTTITKSVRGIQEFRAQASEYELFLLAEKRRMVEHNLRRFEDLVRPIVTAPRLISGGESDQSSGPIYPPLYARSAVCFGTSTLRTNQPKFVKAVYELLEEHAASKATNPGVQLAFSPIHNVFYYSTREPLPKRFYLTKRPTEIFNYEPLEAQASESKLNLPTDEAEGDQKEEGIKDEHTIKQQSIEPVSKGGNDPRETQQLREAEHPQKKLEWSQNAISLIILASMLLFLAVLFSPYKIKIILESR